VVEAELGFTPSAGETLQAEHGLGADTVERIPEDKRGELLDLVERAEFLADKEGGLAEREIQTVQDRIFEFGAENDVSPRNLTPKIEGLQASLAARLSEDSEPAELSGRLSDRQKIATLRDREEDLEADLRDAADGFERLHLKNRLDRVREKRAEIEGSSPSSSPSTGERITAEDLKK